jgi:diaminopimelate decarboxylase
LTQKTLPFTKAEIEEVVKNHPTPFHIYNEKGIRENAKMLKKAFSWEEGFREFYAIKACPNPHILKIMKDEGFGGDASSLPELILAEQVGLTGEMVMFSSNNTPAAEFAKAKQMGAIINLDDLDHVPFLAQTVGLPDLICFRYNPGPLRDGNVIIGKPEEAKYGFTRDQLLEGYRICRDNGVKRFGLHTMVASNELNMDYHVETARMLFDLVADLSQNLGIRFDFVNLGGGFGIPYHPDQQGLNFNMLAGRIREEYERKIKAQNLHPLAIYMESGRAMTGPFGFLVSRVLHMKHTYKDYVGLDACAANLMRPAMYGAYHHITVLGKESLPADHVYDVTGSLCENNDKFAIDRKLPKIEEGDLVVIHDTGAHGHSMGYNYNGKLRSAELLLKPDGCVEQIRRAETIEDYFATLDFQNV